MVNVDVISTVVLSVVCLECGRAALIMRRP